MESEQKSFLWYSKAQLGDLFSIYLITHMFDHVLRLGLDFRIFFQFDFHHFFSSML